MYTAVDKAPFSPPEFGPTGGLFRDPIKVIDPDDQPPVVIINTNPDPPIILSGDVMTFSSGSYDPDDGDTIVSHVWDIYGDGSVIKTGQTVTHVYETTEPNAIWAPRLTVTDGKGVSTSQTFSVGAYTTTPPNLPPVVVIDVEPISGRAP